MQKKAPRSRIFKRRKEKMGGGRETQKGEWLSGRSGGGEGGRGYGGTHFYGACLDSGTPSSYIHGTQWPMLCIAVLCIARVFNQRGSAQRTAHGTQSSSMGMCAGRVFFCFFARYQLLSCFTVEEKKGATESSLTEVARVRSSAVTMTDVESDSMVGA